MGVETPEEITTVMDRGVYDDAQNNESRYCERDAITLLRTCLKDKPLELK